MEHMVDFQVFRDRKLRGAKRVEELQREYEWQSGMSDTNLPLFNKGLGYFVTRPVEGLPLNAILKKFPQMGQDLVFLRLEDLSTKLNDILMHVVENGVTEYAQVHSFWEEANGLGTRMFYRKMQEHEYKALEDGTHHVYLAEQLISLNHREHPKK